MNTWDTQTSKIEQIKSLFNSPLWGIFKYIQERDNFLNDNFFWKETNIDQDIIDGVIKKLNQKLQEIKSQKYEIKNLNINSTQKKFLINSLNITGLKYIMFKSSVYLEAEKFGYKITHKQRKILLKRINKLQDIVYWPEISDIKEEKDQILSLLSNLLNENNKKVTWEEKWIFEDFLDSFDFKKLDLKKNKDSKKLTNTFLSKSQVIQIFQLVLDVYSLDWWIVSVEKVWNFSVRKEEKKIILPEEKIEALSIKRIFQLIDHEIWVHAMRWFNTMKTLHTNWEWYLEGEEWFATVSELLFDNNLQEITVLPTIHHITTFIGENYNFTDTKKILEIFYKLNWFTYDKASKEALDRALRVKRFVSFKEKWANRKDVSYTRGQTQVVNYLQNNQNNEDFIKDFYFSKLALHDIWLVKAFRDILWIDKNELRYPLWIWKILYKKLSWEKIFLDQLKEEDFRFKNIEKISFDIKRKIISILWIIHKN